MKKHALVLVVPLLMFSCQSETKVEESALENEINAIKQQLIEETEKLEAENLKADSELEFYKLEAEAINLLPDGPEKKQKLLDLSGKSILRGLELDSMAKVVDRLEDKLDSLTLLNSKK